MASVAGVDLKVGNREFAAGGCFSTSGERLVESRATLPSGDVVDLFPDAGQVRVLLGERRPLDDLPGEAHEVAQQGLDLLAMQGRGAAVTPLAHERCVVWARAEGVVRLRVTMLERLGAVMTARLEVRDSEGRLREQPPQPPARWAPAMRYFRLAQAAQDVVDAYRNMFLALEALLSQEVQDGPRREQEWLRYALTQLSNRDLIDLSGYVSAPAGDELDAFVRDQYQARRCALFHAKTGTRGAPAGNSRARPRRRSARAALALGP